MTAIGIDKIAFYTPAYYLALATLAERDGIDPQKYHQGIGQDRFSVPSHDEDCVTLAANAAAGILNAEDIAAIDSIFLATESGIDQSKAAAVYVHALLGLRPNCRAVELKQACYSATAGLQMACAYVASHPERKVLLIASDIARYDMHGAAEATQGSAAVAMLISAKPRIAALEGPAGCYTQDVMDFWRPNHRNTPLVDGKLSTMIYMQAAEKAWQDYQAQGGAAFSDFAQYCYHLPFSKMGIKTHQRLCKSNNCAEDNSKIAAGMIYNREIGNSYTAALYLSFCSALDHRDDLSGELVGMLSYGSGCVAEYFALRIQESYLSQRRKENHAVLLAQRSALSLAEYKNFWNRQDYGSKENLVLAPQTRGKFRLAGIEKDERRYSQGIQKRLH